MKKRVMFIASGGGHLTELLQLKPLFKKYNYSLVTERTKNNMHLKNIYKDKIHFMIYGTKDHILTYPIKLFINCWISLFLYIKIRPKYIVTTGVHTAGPMCCIGKLFGSKIIFIETYANIDRRTVTGRIVYKFADLFIVQWKNMLKYYPKATFGGGIF